MSAMTCRFDSCPGQLVVLKRLALPAGVRQCSKIPENSPVHVLDFGKGCTMKARIPSYRLHKARHLAVVTIDGHDHYLGAYGSVESRQLYGQLIAKHAAGLSIEPPKPLSFVSVHEVVLAFMRHAETHYLKNGKLTDEYHCLKSAACRWIRFSRNSTFIGI